MHRESALIQLEQETNTKVVKAWKFSQSDYNAHPNHRHVNLRQLEYIPGFDRRTHKVLLDLLKNPNYNRYEREYDAIKEDFLVKRPLNVYFWENESETQYLIQRFLVQIADLAAFKFPSVRFYSVLNYKSNFKVLVRELDVRKLDARFRMRGERVSIDDFKKILIEKEQIETLIQFRLKMLNEEDIFPIVGDVMSIEISPYDHKAPFLKNNRTAVVSLHDCNDPILYNFVIQQINRFICDKKWEK